MINLLLSLAAGLATGAAVVAFGFPLYAGIIPGTLIFLGVLVVLGRRSFVSLQNVMQAVQNELQSLTPNPKEQKVKVDKAIKMLEAALPLGKWQFMVEGEIYGQIGMIKYLFKDVDGAQQAFKKASKRNYLALAMQAAIAYQKKDFEQMTLAFEEAVKAGKKEGLVWAAYAWCLQQQKQADKAIKVLARGVELNPTDDKLKGALTALQNDKKLKMKAWEPMWWQLGLESPPVPQAQFMGGRRGARFMRR